jgi:hypothetical protein
MFPRQNFPALRTAMPFREKNDTENGSWLAWLAEAPLPYT